MASALILYVGNSNVLHDGPLPPSLISGLSRSTSWPTNENGNPTHTKCRGFLTRHSDDNALDRPQSNLSIDINGLFSEK